jgi:hypothetical protein
MLHSRTRELTQPIEKEESEGNVLGIGGGRGKGRGMESGGGGCRGKRGGGREGEREIYHRSNRA